MIDKSEFQDFLYCPTPGNLQITFLSALCVNLYSCFALCICVAHDDSIWAVAWRKHERDGTEHIVSGGIDDIAKCWKWYVHIVINALCNHKISTTHIWWLF